MSLNEELRRKDSWVNSFFKEHFPEVTTFVKREGPAIKALPIRVSPRSSSPSASSMVGTAFDYRLRLQFGLDAAASSVLQRGIARMQMLGSGLGSTSDRHWAVAVQSLIAAPAAGDEDRLARIAVVLGWLDAGYRSGSWSDGMKRIASGLEAGGSLTWEDCAVAVDDDLAGEVRILMEVAMENLPEGEAICGAEFAGSRAVRGADADLIVEGCLWDVKTTAKPRDELPRVLRQLVGYALLDWENFYQLERAGLYFARHGRWISWPLAQLMRECTGREGATITGLRAAFLKAVPVSRRLRSDRSDG